MSVSTNYTCNTCGLAFGAADYQREHMKTDWHRYNLKRRVADLPPIPADVFAQKMLQVKEQQAEPVHTNRQPTKKDLRRESKQQKRQQNLQNGVGNLNLNRSRTGSLSSVDFSAGEPAKGFVTASEASSATESEDEPQDDVDRLLQRKLKSYVQIPTNVSFMDGHESGSTLENVAYLGQKYGLVIPEEEHVADWDGLVGYFNEKVGLGNCCLSCGYMGRSLAAVRAHMLDKQHVKVPWDTEEEQAEILDFYEDESEDEEWEDLGDDAEADDDTTDTDSHYDEFADTPIVNGFELVLGNSGVSAGHRSLNRYYKQRAGAPLEKDGRKAVRLSDYRSPGVTERSADKFIKKTWQEERKAADRFNRGRKLQNHQKHFRDPLLQ